MYMHATKVILILTLFVFPILGPVCQAQIISGINGEIDLKLSPFFDLGPVPTDDGFVWGPTEDQHQYTPVGFSDVHASFDGDGYYSASGIAEIDYDYEYISAGVSRIDVYANTLPDDVPDCSSTYARIDLAIQTSAPVRYRFEADALNSVLNYTVSFNGMSAYASYSPFGEYEGTFPPVYDYGSPMPTGWDTYVDKGYLPAGEYQMTITAIGGHSRYGTGRATVGTASLIIELLGDIDGNSVVNHDDLDIVLNSWNETVPEGESYPADYNGDGYVGLADLNAVLAGWNSDVRPPFRIAVPEPASAILLLTALGVLLHQRTA